MAGIIWTKAVRIKLKDHLDYAYNEFGAKKNEEMAGANRIY